MCQIKYIALETYQRHDIAKFFAEINGLLTHLFILQFSYLYVYTMVRDFTSECMYNVLEITYYLLL